MKLPVPGNQLPTVTEDMPEDRPFEVVCRKLEVAMDGGIPKQDKHGRNFLSGEFEVIDPPEWKGKLIRDNYIAVPNEHDVATSRGAEVGVRLGRLFNAAKVESDDTDDIIGTTLLVTVKNEEFPEGSGRKNPKVADYYL